MQPPVSYQAALAELEELRQALEDNLVGVEELSAQVQRAYYLLNYCREKLREAEQQIDLIVQAEKDGQNFED
ncbi:MAG: exodeoxyribonuclease VII small subunit [Bernardetiaceae bacterium]|nr:exodeoxyribonuclease VII small subunit [Bernardetiaceae bacterium]